MGEIGYFIGSNIVFSFGVKRTIVFNLSNDSYIILDTEIAKILYSLKNKFLTKEIYDSINHSIRDFVFIEGERNWIKKLNSEYTKGHSLIILEHLVIFIDKICEISVLTDVINMFIRYGGRNVTLVAYDDAIFSLKDVLNSFRGKSIYNIEIFVNKPLDDLIVNLDNEIVNRINVINFFQPKEESILIKNNLKIFHSSYDYLNENLVRISLNHEAYFKSIQSNLYYNKLVILQNSILYTHFESNINSEFNQLPIKIINNSYAMITKKMVRVCRDCEFGPFCLDRSRLIKVSKNLWERTEPCQYNPKTNIWTTD